MTPSEESITAVGDVVGRTVELAEIPAPTGLEDARRERVQTWWLEDGWAEVRTDEVGNLWARVRPGEGPSAVVCAHLDTVFDDTVDHRVRRDGTLLRGPSVGDDSVGVAALSAVGTLLADAPGTAPVWIVATVGEEGLGNLLGISEVIRQDRVPIAAVVAIEGNYLGRIATVGVGSVRWRVTVTGPGGHAWEQAEAPSAVHAAAEIVAALAALPAGTNRPPPRPEPATTPPPAGTPQPPPGPEPATGPQRAGTHPMPPRPDPATTARPAGTPHPSPAPEPATPWPAAGTAVNVGVFSGGEAVNARARQAVFLVDLRATSSYGLAELAARARRVIRAPDATIKVAIEELGRRPAGELAPTHPLALAAAGALRAAGLPPAFTAASTDANAAHAAGVPAIAIGVTTGGGEHTPDEWIDTSQLGTGLRCAAATITGWERGAGEGGGA
jgi:acetylornithine deacetylase/succinyl-diaminopimelate desuccinylase-like protein